MAEENDRSSHTDPTALTTQALFREIASLKESLEARIENEVKCITARLDSMDKAQDKFETNLFRVPTDIDKAVSNLREQHNEKFKAVNALFVERERQVMMLSEAAKEGVAAALQAAKEAVAQQNRSAGEAIAKSETATTKQIDSLGEKVEDLKARVGQVEGRQYGKSEEKKELHGSAAIIISIISALLVLVATGLAIVSFVRK